MPDAPPIPQETPNIVLGKSQAVGFAVRSGIQQVTGAFIVEGIELFNIVDFSEGQARWSGLALGLGVTFVQNFFEQRRNRRFIGPAPIGRTPGV